MHNRSIMATVLLAALASTAQAQSPKEQYNAETKRLATRYAEDKKLCADEQDSGQRMQCLRDAKTEYDKSMALAKAQYKASPAKPGECHDCGKVTQVVVGEKAGEGSALGVIAGGVAGALGEPFLERIWEIALRYALPYVAEGVRYVPAALQDDAGIYGAAAFARDRSGATR